MEKLTLLATGPEEGNVYITDEYINIWKQNQELSSWEKWQKNLVTIIFLAGIHEPGHFIIPPANEVQGGI